MRLNRLLHLLFNTLTAISAVFLLFGIAMLGIDLGFRFSHFFKTGDFRIDGPPYTVNLLRQAEETGLMGTIEFAVLPSLWLYRWHRAKRKRKFPPRPLLAMRLRSSRHARSLPGMRRGGSQRKMISIYPSKPPIQSNRAYPLRAASNPAGFHPKSRSKSVVSHVLSSWLMIT